MTPITLIIGKSTAVICKGKGPKGKMKLALVLMLKETILR